MPAASNRVTIQACSWDLEQLPGLNAELHRQFQSLGLETTAALLNEGTTPEQCNAIATQLHLPLQQVKKWVAMADLSRLPSVGCEYCGILLHSGIASVSQLAHTPVHRLHRQILRMQVSTLQRRDLCPPVQEVQKWVREAQVLQS
ncbi:DUF4332 domain-containing protein [Spirulina subsalsa]|uniref:DUF4332 domain-containing protein n=1 Tax=Spirulina subsalsa TaxID=54311 RepID=UPI0002DDC6E7|nr:DUF4332 domain-containing protein [Spirulina subsalsa]